MLTITAAVLAVYTTAVNPVQERVVQTLVNKFAEQSTAALDKFFDPVTTSLIVERERAAERTLSPEDTASWNERFVPILRQIPQIVAVVVADKNGRSYTLWRTETGFKTRNTDPDPANPEALWQEWADATTRLKSWSEGSDFDPRNRPWFQQMENATADTTPQWTDPYTFHTSGRRGVTASVGNLGEGTAPDSIVIAFDILIDEISRLTAKLEVGEQGNMFIVTESGLLVGAPRHGSTVDPAGLETALSTPVTEFPLPEVRAAFKEWSSEPITRDEPFPYVADRSQWWAAFRHYPVGARNLWVATILPQQELVSRMGARPQLVPWAILAAGLLAAVAVGIYTVRHQRSMDAMRAQLHASAVKTSNQPSASTDEIAALIAKGESDRLEFKSTVRWNIRAGKPGKEIELAWLKTVVAYLNTAGGTILIGVDDDGIIVGTAVDQFVSDDKCLRHIDNLITDHIGSEYFPSIKLRAHQFGEHRVISIHCQSSSKPAFLKTGKDEEFYVRSGPASRKLPPSQILDYVAGRQTQT